MESIFENKDCISPIKKIPSIKVFGEEYPDDEHKPFFTIAIPTYKRTSTLYFAINSALQQEGFYDYEIIVVDNNPERGDATEVFMQKYSTCSQITYYKNSENLGMAGNWNKCMLLAKSENVILLHDDDIIFPFALKIFSRIVKNTRKDLCVIKPQLMKFSDFKELSPRIGVDYTLRKLNRFDFSFSCPVGAPSCILFNKTNYINAGGANEDFYPCIDYSLNLRLSQLGSSYLLIGECLGGYRVANNESLKESTMDKYFFERYRISDAVLRSFYIPKNIREMIQAAKIERFAENVKSYYNMKEYHYKYEYYPQLNISERKQRFINSLFEFVERINTRLNVKSVSIV